MTADPTDRTDRRVQCPSCLGQRTYVEHPHEGWNEYACDSCGFAWDDLAQKDRTDELINRIGHQLGYLRGESYMLDISFTATRYLSDFEMDRLEMMLDAIQTIKLLRAEMEEEEATK